MAKTGTNAARGGAEQASAPSERLWCVGDAGEALPAVPGIVYDDTLHPRTTAVLALPGADEALFQELYRWQRLELPVLDFTREGLPRADYVGDRLTPDNLDAVLRAVEPVRTRGAELPEAVGADREQIAALRLAYTRDREIEARWTFRDPALVDYPLLTGIPARRGTLDQLFEAGLVTRRLFDRVHLCGTCGGSRLNVREECTQCRSSDVEERSLVHHYACAHQADEAQFASGNRLECPKCRRELRHYGVDYDRPGSVFVCNDCAGASPEPAVGFRCLDCEAHTGGERIETRAWYHYRVTPEGVGALESGLLPASSLEAVVRGAPGARNRREFARLVDFYAEVAGRYERPVVMAVLTICNAEAIRRELGGTGLSKTFALIAEIVSNALRRSDAVTAADHSLYLLLPETDQRRLGQLVERIQKRLEANVAKSVELEVETVPMDRVEAILERLAT